MRLPRRWERRAEGFQQRVLRIPDEDLRFAVGIILACLHDGEDDCAWAVFAAESKLRIMAIQVDKDIAEGLTRRVGEETFQAAVRWLQGQLDGGDPAWTAWLLHRVKVHGIEDMQEIVGKDGVVYDIELRRVTKKQKRKRR